jgi:hypothetical protein
MNMFSKPIAAFIFVCLLGVFSFAQSPLRRVQGRILTSKDLPKIRLKFDKKFKFSGSHQFVLYDRAKAEQYFFVEAESKKIKRMFMLQFEGFLPNIEAQYNYNEPNSVEFGGLKYFSNAEFVPNVEMALKAVPDSDIARAARFLQEKGFVQMKSLVFQRFVRVIDEAKRNEFIMVYIEEAEDEKSLQDLSDRARENFKVLK